MSSLFLFISGHFWFLQGEGKVASADVVWHQEHLCDRCHLLALSLRWCFQSFSYLAGPLWCLLSQHGQSPSRPLLLILSQLLQPVVALLRTQPLFARGPGPARQASWADSSDDSSSPTVSLSSRFTHVKMRPVPCRTLKV